MLLQRKGLMVQKRSRHQIKEELSDPSDSMAYSEIWKAKFSPCIDVRLLRFFLVVHSYIWWHVLLRLNLSAQIYFTPLKRKRNNKKKEFFPLFFKYLLIQYKNKSSYYKHIVFWTTPPDFFIPLMAHIWKKVREFTHSQWIYTGAWVHKNYSVSWHSCGPRCSQMIQKEPWFFFLTKVVQLQNCKCYHQLY